MLKITVKIEGMKCPMCEAHANEAVKKAFAVKSVESSHVNKETVIVTDGAIDHELLKAEIEKTGYQVIDIFEEECEKKGFFASLFGKK
jgi:copper chaperone CopZ